MTPADTARGLRQLARYLEQPTDARPADAPPALEPECIELARSLVTVFLDGPEALRRARDYGGRGYAGGGRAEGTGKGGHSSPTERAALTDRPDDFTLAGHQVLTKTTDATAALNVAARTIRQLLTTAPAQTQVDEARCTTIGCTDLEVTKRRCRWCYDFVRRHGHEPTDTDLATRWRKTRLAG